MSNVTVKEGNLFTSRQQTLVNTVNCDGVMGAGIALVFKLRFPEMFDQYVEHCRAGRIDIGKLWIYKPPAAAGDPRWVLNFPTKRRWKHPSKVEYLEAGLKKFLGTYQNRGIQSIAFPLLGAANGGLTEKKSLSVMKGYLDRCEIPVEIYRYDPAAADDVYAEFRRLWLAADEAAVAKNAGVRIDRVRKIRSALEENDEINSLSRLASVEGIGSKTLEKCFRYVMEGHETANPDPAAPTLF